MDFRNPEDACTNHKSFHDMGLQEYETAPTEQLHNLKKCDSTHLLRASIDMLSEPSFWQNGYTVLPQHPR